MAGTAGIAAGGGAGGLGAGGFFGFFGFVGFFGFAPPSSLPSSSTTASARVGDDVPVEGALGAWPVPPASGFSPPAGDGRGAGWFGDGGVGVGVGGAGGLGECWGGLDGEVGDGGSGACVAEAGGGCSGGDVALGPTKEEAASAFSEDGADCEDVGVNNLAAALPEPCVLGTGEAGGIAASPDAAGVSVKGAAVRVACTPGCGRPDQR